MDENTSADAPVPVLAVGRHPVPGDQACVMELASLLAREPWSDHPACVHPVLASVARVVNDRLSERGRLRLAPLATKMIGTRGGDPAVSARLVELCAGAALRYPSALRHELAAAWRTAGYVLTYLGERPGACPLPARLALGALHRAGLLEQVSRREATAHAALAVAVLASVRPAHDEELIGLLVRCVETCREGLAGARSRAPRRS